MSRVQLYLGDCLVEMGKITDGSVDCICADLPYGTTACAWDSVIPFAPLWAHFKRVIKPRGAIVLFGSQPFTSALIMSNIEWFKYEWIWQKSKATGHLDANRRPLKSHESICLFCNGQPTYFPQMQKCNIHPRGRKSSKQTDVYGKFNHAIYFSDELYPKSIVTISGVQKVVHPTQKPVALFAYLIRTYTNPGETVLDCTMGSGSTGVAAMETGRKFVGIEKDAAYFDIAVRRISDASRAADGLPKQLSGNQNDYAGLPMFEQANDVAVSA